MKMFEILSNIVPITPQKGDIGIEIEVEGDNLPYNVSLSKVWRQDADGSLQGPSCEYVMNKPGSAGEVEEALDLLWYNYTLNDTHIRESIRAGVHVHINVQDMTPKTMFNFVCLYIILEEVLLEHCGENRKGNHFCLRVKDAEYIIHKIIDSITNNNLGDLGDENIRYSSLNMTSLLKYGSIEFRSMRSTSVKEDISFWANLLLHLRESSLEFSTPEDIVSEFSHMGYKDFMKRVLGKYYKTFEEVDDIEQKVLRGVRYAQDIAFCGIMDWDELYQTGQKKIKEQADGISDTQQRAFDRVSTSFNIVTPSSLAPFTTTTMMEADEPEDLDEDWDELYEEDIDYE